MYFEMTPLGLIMVHIVCNLKSNSLNFLFWHSLYTLLLKQCFNQIQNGVNLQIYTLTKHSKHPHII